MKTVSQLHRRIRDIEQQDSNKNKIIQFPELRDLMQIADTGDINKMYDYFDQHARRDVYPGIEERRAMIPEIFKNKSDDI